MELFAQIQGSLEDAGFTISSAHDDSMFLSSRLDWRKSLKFPIFKEAITGGTGFVNKIVVQRNLQGAAHALLRQVLGQFGQWSGSVLQDHGNLVLSAWQGTNQHVDIVLPDSFSCS